MLLSAGPISSSPISAADADNTIGITFPLFTLDLFAILSPWEGMELGGLDDVRIIASLGEINRIDTTFPLFIFLGGDNVVNTIDIELGGLDDVRFNGVVNLQAGSGIYKITTDKTHDKYYSNVVAGTFTDAKFPNPFIQTALLHDEDEKIIHTHSYRIRVVGSGNLHATLYTLNSVRSQTLTDIVLTATSAREQTVLSNFASQRIMLKLQTDAIDNTFDITRIIMFLKTLWTQKPQ